MLNLYSVKTRVVATDRWDGPQPKPLLDTVYRNYIVSDSFEAAVATGKELATKQCANYFLHANETTVNVTTHEDEVPQWMITEPVKPYFPKHPDMDVSTVECTLEATGLTIDPSVLTAQVTA